MRLSLGSSNGGGTDCHGAITNIGRPRIRGPRRDHTLLVGYRYIIRSDYGHPGNPRSPARRRRAPRSAPTCSSTRRRRHDLHRLRERVRSDELGPYIECAGAQIYTFYAADNSMSKLVDFAPATNVLYVGGPHCICGRRTGQRGRPHGGRRHEDRRDHGRGHPDATGIVDLRYRGAAGPRKSRMPERCRLGRPVHPDDEHGYEQYRRAHGPGNKTTQQAINPVPTADGRLRRCRPAVPDHELASRTSRA